MVEHESGLAYADVFKTLTINQVHSSTIEYQVDGLGVLLIVLHSNYIVK